MKKIALLTLLLFIAFVKVKAQDVVSPEQFQKLIDYLKDENWDEAAKLSNSYLNNISAENLDTDAAANVRYMYLISEAGLMNKEKLTQKQALQNVSKFTGHRIILPWQYVSVKGGLNYLQPASKKTDTLMVTTTNIKATEIFAFNYIVPAEAISLEDFTKMNGKLCRVSGTLQSVKVAGHILPRYQLLIDKAILGFDDK